MDITDLKDVHWALKEDWQVGDKFTTPETGDMVFTVCEVNRYDVQAMDARSRAGYTIFSKSYITKIK